jgi:thioredoxin 1
MSVGNSLQEWGEERFTRKVLNFPGRAVVMFGDPRWSSPCHQTRRHLARLAPQYPEVLIGVVNVSDHWDLAYRYGAMALPTVVVFEAGREVHRVIGVRAEAVWRELLSGEER